MSTQKAISSIENDDNKVPVINQCFIIIPIGEVNSDTRQQNKLQYSKN